MFFVSERSSFFPISFAAELDVAFMPIESQRFILCGGCEKLRACYRQCKVKPYEPGITEALSLTEDYNTCVRLQTPSNVVREDEAPREPLEMR